MRRTLSVGWALAPALAVACVGPRGGDPQALPASAATARRVVQIFDRHHLRPRPLDDALSASMFERVIRGVERRGRCPDLGRALSGDRSRLDEALREGDFSLPARAAQRCGLAPEGEGASRAALLAAYAAAHDPHSAYLSAGELASMRGAIHHPVADAPRARGKLVEYRGVRIAIVELPSFYLDTRGGAAGDTRHLLGALAEQGAEVVLLDLRGNSGGVESEAAGLAGVFSGEAMVGQKLMAGGESELLRARGEAAWEGPLVVAVDAGTASVAEVFAAAIQDTGRGLVVGRRTHGKGTGQTLVLLSSPTGGRDGAVRVTDRRYHRLDGAPLQRLGVTPDVELPPAPQAASDAPTERERAGALSFDPVAAAPGRADVAPKPDPTARRPAAAIELLSTCARQAAWSCR